MPSTRSPIIDCFIALRNLLSFIFRNASERPSPRDIIKPHQVLWNKDVGSIVIRGIKGFVWITGVANTNSMDGLLDYGHTVLLIKEFDKSQLAVGDIVVYQPTKRYANQIIHRIVKIGEDEQGRWYKTRGDNCATTDPYKLRNNHILFLCIGILY